MARNGPVFGLTRGWILVGTGLVLLLIASGVGAIALARDRQESAAGCTETTIAASEQAEAACEDTDGGATLDGSVTAPPRSEAPPSSGAAKTGMSDGGGGPAGNPGPCPVGGTNVAGGQDPWGGCWPGPGNTGVPAGITLSPYTGPCTITEANAVIDSRTVTCSDLSIEAPGVVIRNSLLQGTDVNNRESGSASFTIVDSTVVNGARDACGCIGYHDFTAIRVNVEGGNRSMYCEARCTIQDSWLHGQQLQGAQHGSGLREEQYTEATHNSIACDYPYYDDSSTLGCSAALTGYPDFAPIHHNTIRRNLFLSSPTGSYCAYGGASSGKEFSSAAENATYQVFVENVFQRGSSGRCGAYGAAVDFARSRPGNVWSGNIWDSGEPANAG